MKLVIWIAILNISARTIAKINAKHGLTAEEVRDAVELRSGLRAEPNDDPERGYRVFLKVTIRNRRYLVVLKPTNDADVFNLVSAYPE